MIRRTVTAACCLVLGCAPEFDDAPWRVDEPRVLAIAANPPEARPGDPVALTALSASPDGTLTTATTWSVCTRPRTSSERTSVTARCLEDDFLEATSASMVVLEDACARFGPNPPPIEGDAAPQRPADPDATGGYFLPVRAKADAALAFGAVRIRCDLPGVTRAIFDAFEERYVANDPPQIEGVFLNDETALSANEVASAEPLLAATISVRLPATAAQPYVRYDSARGDLVDEREWLRVQWFVTDGELSASQQLVVAPDSGSPVAVTSWTAPPGPATVHGWVVVTDARGGVVWSAFTIEVDAQDA